ncbi:hypothetical protein GALMADRAFT_237655 [Galerina marginata CBS 339.88]|uniref:Telomere-associated protein Rif1 N-terminal domain-containing protein n=1 Tax=Galerina marginata (strain CBS 339.88) TaxID=685588 RepID=A0A067TJ61_GALM3|nr:hypothetical protein GALMADRAFT_237655 [Galerina marginata CBS 339.88]
MSLLTPPSSSHRSDKDKENKFSAPVAGPSTRSVIWATENSIHSLATPPKANTISSKHRPKATKSILKKSSQDNTFLMVPEVTKQRETTPEPADPLVDLHYLDHPVAQILSNEISDEQSLRELIEGYNVLAARLRACVADSTDADASWPLFQPLRKNTQPFVNAVVRDLARALVDPLSYRTDIAEEDATSVPKFTLPSPEKSPAKKKGGLSAEQVKYARDLCTTCHSVIKVLSVILSVPAIFAVFEEEQLSEMLTAVLAIPLAEELPTPNARKTCALAIWLIQVQRLPEPVLRPAADRIAYALRRGMDGELGKEGKKGSANDGLKAIHDLCTYLPDVFVPAFTPLLPSILSNLLASTFNLRTQACHALGGFANASTSVPLSTVHTRISNTVTTYLTTTPPPSAKSPTKPTEAPIVRTLRTTLGCVDPPHVAQGPVWALSVLASFVVLLHSRLSVDPRVNRILSSLLGLGMRHKKSSVRALCCIVWRPVIWAYFQPPLPVNSEDEDEQDVKDAEKVSPDQVKKVYLRVMMSVVEMQTGISTIAALLGEETTTGEEPLRQCLEVLQNMATKPQPTCADAIEAMRHMTTLSSSGRDAVDAWDANLLLPKGLFSSNPGLLTAEFKNLSTAVRPLFDQVAMFQDIRYLTREEMSRSWVFNGILNAWKTALGNVDMFDDSEVPDNLMEIWTNFLKANVFQEDGDGASTKQFAFNAVLHLVDIAQDPLLDLRPEKVPIPGPSNDRVPGSDDTIPDFDETSSCHCTNNELRLRVIQRLWVAMKTIIPHSLLEVAANKLIEALLESRKSLIPQSSRLEGYTDEDVEGPRNAWISLCMDVLTVCDVETFKTFWSCETDLGPDVSSWTWTKDFTRAIWKASAEKWVEGEGHWEAGVVLLGLPFSDRHAWNPVGEDYNTWEDILTYTTGKALDHGFNTAHVLDTIANFISYFQTPGLHPAPSTRLVDVLLSHIDLSELGELPLQAIELASITMRATYPPEPRNTPVAMWMVRSLTNLIEHCPPELCLRLLHTLEDGLSLWLADECDAWSSRDLNYDVIPLYQHILVRIRALPESIQNLKVLENILASVFTKRTLPSAIEAFTEYWNLTYSRIPPSDQGWSDTIIECLKAVGILPKSSNDEESVPSSPLAPALIIPPSTPRTPVASSFSTPPTAIIKREALHKLPSPQRPQKVFGTFPIVPTTPLSPIRRRSSSSSSTRRTPLSSIQLCGSPSKRRRLMVEGDSDEEKENSLVGVVSVTDRIAELKPYGKKRRHEDDEEDPQPEPSPMKKLKGKMKPKGKPVAKKLRTASPAPCAASSNESKDERKVAAALVESLPFPSMEPANDSPEVFVCSAAGSSRRKGGFADTVPAQPSHPPIQLQRERDQVKSLDSQDTPVQRIDLAKMLIRRSVSFPESLLMAATDRKRKRDSDIEDDQDLYDASTSDPLPALSLPRPRQLKKAHTLPSLDSDVTVQSISSDDDPHLGQVTPHHLISPAMARRSHYGGSLTSQSALSIMRELFGDEMPGSDDSTTSEPDSESPTKEFMTRQLQKMRSESRFSKTLST